MYLQRYLQRYPLCTILQRYPPYNEATLEAQHQATQLAEAQTEVATLEAQHQVDCACLELVDMERLEGRWEDRKGSQYIVSPGRVTCTCNVETRRPNGAVRFTQGLIKLESGRIYWGRNFKLAAPPAEEIRWVSDRRSEFVWHKISRSRSKRKKKRQSRRKRKKKSRSRSKKKSRSRSNKDRSRSKKKSKSCSRRRSRSRKSRSHKRSHKSRYVEATPKRYVRRVLFLNEATQRAYDRAQRPQSGSGYIE